MAGLRARVGTCACMCVRKFRCGLMARHTWLGHGPISRRASDITALRRRAVHCCAAWACPQARPAGSKTQRPVLLTTVPRLFIWQRERRHGSGFQGPVYPPWSGWAKRRPMEMFTFGSTIVKVKSLLPSGGLQFAPLYLIMFTTGLRTLSAKKRLNHQRHL